jgi:hypothetical protein
MRNPTCIRPLTEFLCLGVRALPSSGGDCARQPGAARVGNHPMGQRIRRLGKAAILRQG